MQNLWKGQKVSEKVFGRVLISSICGIFLCLACLVSATWAWYVVGIENPDNTIEIATVTAHVTVDDGSILAGEDGAYALPMGAHILQVKPDNQNAAAYVVMSVNGTPTCCFAFASGQNAPATMQVTVYEAEAKLSFQSQWTHPEVAPAGPELTIGTAPAATEDQEDSDAQPPAEVENTEDSTPPADSGASEGSNIPESSDTPDANEEPETGADSEIDDVPEAGTDLQPESDQ